MTSIEVIAEALAKHCYSISYDERCVCGVKTDNMPAHQASVIAALPDIAIVPRYSVGLPMLMPAETFEFGGCTSTNLDVCACETYTVPDCCVCGEEINTAAWVMERIGNPALPADHEEQEWDNFVWHEACDLLAAARAAGGES